MTSKEAIANMVVGSDAIPEEYRSMLAAAVEASDERTIGGLMADALAAKALLDAGDKEGCREILNRYKDLAESCGFGPVFEQFLGGIAD